LPFNPPHFFCHLHIKNKLGQEFHNDRASQPETDRETDNITIPQSLMVQITQAPSNNWATSLQKNTTITLVQYHKRTTAYFHFNMRK